MAQPILPTAVYTLRDLCVLLRISDSTARRWIRERILPPRRIGRDYRFLGSDLLGALDHPKVLGWSLPDEQQAITEIKSALDFAPSHNP